MDLQSVPSQKPAVVQRQPPLTAQESLPTMYDLPSANPQGPGLPDEYHYLQPQLLSATLRLRQYAADQVFSVGDMNLYYDVEHPRWYKRPDWFAVAGVPRLYEGRDMRLSYVAWQERVNPFVVVELLSPGTEEDLGQTQGEPEQPPTKWEVYEQILRIPYYVIFDRYRDQLRGFQLVGGAYQPLPLPQQRVVIPQWQLSLGVWSGVYCGVERPWLRWFNAAGERIPTAEERAQRLAQRLRELGEDPEAL